MIDNAHLLPERTLEMALDICTWRDADGALLQGLLFTEPQIKSVLNQLPDELRDRLPMQQIYINPFTQEQSADYLLHRLRLAGLAEEALPFDPEELDELQRTSQGLPGRIDKVAHRTLLERALGNQGGKKRSKKRPSGGAKKPLPLTRLALAGITVAVAAGIAYGLLVPLSNEGTPRSPVEEPQHEVRSLDLPPPPTKPMPTSTPRGGGTTEPEVMIRAAKPEERTAAATPPKPRPTPSPTPTSTPAAKPARDEALPAPAMPEPLKPPVARSAAAEPTPSPTPTKAAAVAPSAAPPPALTERPMRETGVLTLDPAKYTIQLMSHESEEKVRQFILEHGLAEQAALVRLKYPDGRDKFTVLLGLHEWNRDAKAAIQELPQALRDYRPWSRNISHIQEELRKLRR